MWVRSVSNWIDVERLATRRASTHPVPLLKLGELTGAGEAVAFESGLLMVLESDGNQVVLLVDSLLGQEQVVIKSLEANYRRTAHIAGATILGEGHVVLILDVGSLVRAARE